MNATPNVPRGTPPAGPPTADELRAAIAEMGTWPKPNPLTAQLRELIDDWADVLKSPAWDALESDDPRDPAGDDSALWCDLRPSEAVRLQAFAAAAIDRAFDRCLEAIADELVIAGRAFAVEFPDAPRPVR